MTYKPPAGLIFFPCAYSLSQTQILSGPHRHLFTKTETSSPPATFAFRPVYFHLNWGGNKHWYVWKIANKYLQTCKKKIQSCNKVLKSYSLTRQLHQAYNQVKNKTKSRLLLLNIYTYVPPSLFVKAVCILARRGEQNWREKPFVLRTWRPQPVCFWGLQGPALAWSWGPNTHQQLEHVSLLKFILKEPSSHSETALGGKPESSVSTIRICFTGTFLVQTKMLSWAYPRVIALQYQNLLQTKGTPKGKLACKHSENIILVEVFPHLEVSNEQTYSASPPPHRRGDGRRMPDKKKWNR